MSITAPQFQLKPSESSPSLPLADDDAVPVISRPCQWKPPRKRKESNMPLAEAHFEKHTYGKEKKRKLQSLEDFDPRPLEFRGTLKDRLPALLEKIRGEHLCMSLLFDEHFQHWENAETPLQPQLPDVVSLRKTVEAFKASLAVTDEMIHKIERDTRQQRNSQLWYNVRQYRITASIFGIVCQRRPDTPPDHLVMKILQPKHFTSAATDWGIRHESVAIEQYVKHQQNHGHPNLTVTSCGFHISKSHPFLGASPDGAIYDPSNLCEPFGFLEVKCPYSARNITPVEACSLSGFCCSVNTCSDGTQQLVLRTNHQYYAQIQGQMAVGGRPWSDFVVYTPKGISVERIPFNKDYWETTILLKLVQFYDNCLGPEIVSPIHSLGLPIRNLN